VNQLNVEGQGSHILDDSEATYTDTLVLHPAPILQSNRRIQLHVDIGWISFSNENLILNDKILLKKLSSIEHEAFQYSLKKRFETKRK
jgi:hypothetical protein